MSSFAGFSFVHEEFNNSLLAIIDQNLDKRNVSGIQALSTEHTITLCVRKRC
jgi:hypothetical protein